MDADAVILPVLPKGSILPCTDGGAGCKLLALEVQAPGINVYRAYDLALSRCCPVCANREPAQLVICRTCGADLSGVRPSNAVILLHEGADASRLEPGSAIHLAGVRHPHLLLPVHVQRVGLADGATRSYLSMPEHPAPALSDLPAPHSPPTVMRWGAQLADALARLQVAELSHGKIDLQHVLVRPDRAWLACEPGLAPAQHPSSLGRDVQQLARVLLYALTGSDDPTGSTALPLPICRALEAGLFVDPQVGAPAVRFAGALASAVEEIEMWAQARTSVSWATDHGLHRLDNEDSLTALTLDATYAGIRSNVGVYMVADGAGGRAAGELASRTAVETVMEYLAAHSLAKVAGGSLPAACDLSAELTSAFSAANMAIRRLRANRSEKLATTLTVLIVTGQRGLVAHAGDTRLYRWNGVELQQVTHDHTLAAHLRAEASPSDPRQARTLGRNQLECALGAADMIEPEVCELNLAADEVLLLCSDGLTSEIADSQIAEILARSASLKLAAHSLLDSANAAGGRDNITVVLVRPCDRSDLQ